MDSIRDFFVVLVFSILAAVMWLIGCALILALYAGAVAIGIGLPIYFIVWALKALGVVA